jgi:hypothetical protein
LLQQSAAAMSFSRGFKAFRAAAAAELFRWAAEDVQGVRLERIEKMEMWIGRFLEGLVMMSPGFLVDLVGAILALVWWRRHPRVSLLTLLAIGLGVSVAIGGSFLFAWLPAHLILERGWSFEQTIALYPVIGLIRSALGALAFALLLSAIFTDRSSKNRLQSLPTSAGGPEAREPKEVERSEQITAAARPREAR